MANKINIFQEEWCDLLFEERNQEYGAFLLRKDSGKNHFRAILITILLFTLVVTLPGIIKRVLPKEKIKNVEVTSLSDLKLEQKKKTEETKEIVVKEYKPVKAAIRFVPPVIKPDDEVNEQDTIKSVEQVNQSKGVISTINQEGVVDNPDAVNPDLVQIIEDTAKTVYTYVEQMPEFPGGEDELRRYLAQNTHYPQLAQENGISGKVFIRFVVGKDGRVADIEVVRSVDPSLDREAVRVVKSMPPWKVGRQNGAPVRVSISLPVNFKLE